MAELSDRQLQILKAIIEEYIETAEPVASETLDKKYNLGVSPATIRNEMVRLTTSGFLKQPHTSAGRAPTPHAMKLYVEKLMKPRELSVADEVSVKQKIWDYRAKMDRALKEATKTLAHETGTMSIAATDDGDMYSAGIGNILDMPEFYDIDITKHLLQTLDEYDYWWGIMESFAQSVDPLEVFLGEDLRRKYLMSCGGIFVHFASDKHSGAIGVVGPTRLNYSRIVPVVRYMGNLISEIAKQW
jgi:heat-inducible transcriptional repressor